MSGILPTTERSRMNLGKEDRLDIVRSLTVAEMMIRKPRCQRDCCAMAARIDVTLYGAPESYPELFGRARAIAEGLFGEAYEAAGEAQRWAWIDMCEAELRRASAMAD